MSKTLDSDIQAANLEARDNEEHMNIRDMRNNDTSLNVAPVGRDTTKQRNTSVTPGLPMDA